MFTLRAGSSHGVAHVVAPPQAIAFTTRGRDDGLSVESQEELSYALKNPGAGGRSNDRMIAHVVATPLTASNDPSRSPQSSEVTQQVEAVLRATYLEVAEVCGTISDGAHNGGGLNGQDAYTGRILPVAFNTTQITHPANRSVPKPGDPCHTLAAGDHAPAVALDARQSDACVYGEKTGPLDTDGHLIGVCERTSVRRLLPVECERLQGFPDDYTRIPWKRKPANECPDGPRYKALGNSMAVPCMMWIGKQIQKAMT